MCDSPEWTQHSKSEPEAPARQQCTEMVLAEKVRAGSLRKLAFFVQPSQRMSSTLHTTETKAPSECGVARAETDA